MQHPVTSRENPHAKRLDMLLRQKKAREESGAFVLEGARLCLDALSAGLLPETALLTQSALEKTPALARLTGAAGETVLLAESLAQRLGDTKNPQGVFCICKQPARDASAAKIQPNGRYLLLHQIQDPGNLGTMIRTAAALGVTAAFLSDCAELYSPKVLRAAMGGVWRMSVTVCEALEPLLEQLRAAGVKPYAAALAESAHLPDVLGPGTAILIGNEGSGLPEPLIAACAGVISIPMHSGTESLNAAMAAGILLWEMTKA